MTSGKRIVLILACALSLIIIAGIVHAQTPAQRGTAPTVVSGGDLGFRVEGRRGDHVTGTLVVRINGEWVVAEPAAGAKALTGK
jgi:hypothetical protein